MHTADPKLRWHILALALLVLALGLAGEWANPWLRYDRAAVADGQLWRLVTCHLVHLNLWHMAMNLAGFLMCWFFFTDLLTRKILWLWFAVSAPAVGIAFYFLDTNLHWYVGLSGILHGFLVMCLLLGIREQPILHGLVLAVVAGRLIWEQMPGYDLYYLRDVIQGRVHVNAHLYGSVMGVVVGCGLLLRRKEGADGEQEKS